MEGRPEVLGKVHVPRTQVACRRLTRREGERNTRGMASWHLHQYAKAAQPKSQIASQNQRYVVTIALPRRGSGAVKVKEMDFINPRPKTYYYRKWQPSGRRGLWSINN